VDGRIVAVVGGDFPGSFVVGVLGAGAATAIVGFLIGRVLAGFLAGMNTSNGSGGVATASAALAVTAFNGLLVWDGFGETFSDGLGPGFCSIPEVSARLMPAESNIAMIATTITLTNLSRLSNAAIMVDLPSDGGALLPIAACGGELPLHPSGTAIWPSVTKKWLELEFCSVLSAHPGFGFPGFPARGNCGGRSLWRIGPAA
jgi:hypothetical protein